MPGPWEDYGGPDSAVATLPDAPQAADAAPPPWTEYQDSTPESGPWTDYQDTTPAGGPWTDYQPQPSIGQQLAQSVGFTPAFTEHPTLAALPSELVGLPGRFISKALQPVGRLAAGALNLPAEALGYAPPFAAEKPIVSLPQTDVAAEAARYGLGPVSRGALQAANVVSQTLGSLLTPESLATLPAFAEATLGKVLAGMFAASAGAQAVSAAPSAWQTVTDPTASAEQKVQAVASVGVPLGLSALLARGLSGSPDTLQKLTPDDWRKIDESVPSQQPAAAPAAQPEKGQYAPETRPQSGIEQHPGAPQGTTIPTNPEEIRQISGGPPGSSGSAARQPEAAPPVAPPAEPGATSGQPTPASVVDEAIAADPAAWTKMSREMPGGFTTEAYRIGDNIRGDDALIQKVKDAETKTRDDARAAIKSKDLETAMSLSTKKQFFSEIRQRAERTGSAEFARQREGPEQIVAAAYKTPGGQIETGSNHPEILNRIGLRGFETPESRNTPAFGFVTDRGRFVTREEAGPLSKASGQNLQPFDPGEPVHSNEVAAPARPQPGVAPTPMSETASVAPETRPAPQLIPPQPPLSIGPGAQTAGEAPYSAAAQLTDRLNALPAAGARDKLVLADRVAEQFARDKSQFQAAVTKARAVGTVLRDTARGIRDINDLDRNIGTFQWATNESVARSNQMGKAIKNQQRSQTVREAAAILSESTPEEARQALEALPVFTPPSVRRAVALAAQPTRELMDLTGELKDYYGQRNQDAMQSGLYEQGLSDYYTHIWKNLDNMPTGLRDAVASGRISTWFRFGTKRTIPTLLEGIQQGKVPILDPADVLPYYNFSMDKAIASREFIRRFLDSTASDGRPAAEVAGVGRAVGPEPGDTDAILVNPHGRPRSADVQDYASVDHPALRGWKWVSKSAEGTSVFLKGDVLIHPEYVERIKRLMDRTRLNPGPIMRAALTASGTVKGFKLGVLSAFHNVHVGTHAAFHWTNPFTAVRHEINWDDPFTRFAVEQGHITLAPSAEELSLASEGILSQGLIHHVPLIGPWSKEWSHFTFSEMIPRLKLSTFRSAYNRNIWVRDHLPMSGLKGLTDEQIAMRVGDSINNAFGELNRIFLGRLGRDPETQRYLRLLFLAPDFGEARLRFVGKAFTKRGFEERLALATMFTTLYVGARYGNWLSHGDAEWDWRRAFSVKVGQHWWSMRSVVGDLDHALGDFGRFAYVRLNPLFSRTLADALFGRDISGRKLTWMDISKRLAEQLLAIQLGGLARPDQRVWESFVTSMGVSVYRDTPQMDISRLAQQWLTASGKQSEGEFIPMEGPSYAKLRAAIRIGSDRTAASVLTALREKHTDAEIQKAMVAASKRPFTGSNNLEPQFVDSLSPLQADTYLRAQEERRQELEKFYDLLVR